MKYSDEIILPTDEEMEIFWTERKALDKWANSLSDNQIDFICNRGYYNRAIKGYVIQACRNAGLDDETIKKVLFGLNWALDEKSKRDAELVEDRYYTLK